MANLYLSVLLVLSMLACNPQLSSPVVEEEVGPSRRALIRSSRRSGEWLWVYSAADSLEAQAYQKMLAIVEEDPPFNHKVQLRSADQVSAEDLARQSLVLIGSTWPETWREKVNASSHWKLQATGFQFAEEEFTGNRDVLQLSYCPNPWNQEWPMHFMTANSDQYLRNYLKNTYDGDWEQMFWGSWGYSVFKGGHTRFLGYLADTTWQIDPNNHFAFSNEVVELANIPGAKWIGHELAKETNGASNHLMTMVDSFRLRRDSLERFLDQDINTEISFHLYNSVEDKGMRKQNMDPAQAIFDRNEVHLVSNNYFRGDQLGEDMRLLIRKTLGKPKTLALEYGLALLFAPQWGEGKGPHYWSARLSQSNNLPPLADLVDNELFSKESPLVMPVAASAFVDFLLQAYGKETLLENYQNWSADSAKLAGLQKEWEQFLETNYQIQIPAAKRQVDEEFLKGFTFAHEGYRVYNGYGSRAAQRSITELHELGTKALSIVPYSYMRSPQRASFIPVVRQAGTENDPATLFAHFNAKNLGMFSLLKPQIWVSGSWPGDIDFASEKEWDLFFDYYYRWMRHYVLMAEMYGYDAIAVGTEFVKSTSKYPDRWRQMLQKWRGLYRGPFTYAANWGQEFESLAFWDELDYLGCNCYYPLAEQDSVDQAMLEKGVTAMLDKITQIAQKTSKPIWLTEIGYRSVTAPWRNPHAEANGRAANAEHQAMAYQALLNTLPKYDQITGIFVWKWPCYLEYSRRSDKGFTPLGKPAEALWSDAFNGAN